VPAASFVVATPAPAVSAQLGFPFFDIGALLASIFDSLPTFFQDILGPFFAALLQLFTGGCVGPFCASP
jgi:hypothetical protein